MEGIMGEIRMFAPSFAPKYWAFCRGQILPIAQNQALFSILGVIYGGNGINNFALPDLQGRAPYGASMSGTSNYWLGQKIGSEVTLLTPANLPAHNHPVTGTIKAAASSVAADLPIASSHNFANDGSGKFSFSNSGNTMKPANLNLSVVNAGTGQGVGNRMPFLGFNYIICIQGVYPSRG